ncbi:NAD(P)H-dependent oxidoreductase, partial [Mycolicibacterium smegmatis]
MAEIKVLVLVGSLRAASINRQLAELAVETAPDGVDLQVFDRLAEVPFYNEDIDTADVPEPAAALRAAAVEADAALLVTPEYNAT